MTDVTELYLLHWEYWEFQPEGGGRALPVRDQNVAGGAGGVAAKGGRDDVGVEQASVARTAREEPGDVEGKGGERRESLVGKDVGEKYQYPATPPRTIVQSLVGDADGPSGQD